LRVIAYANRSLSKPEKNYSVFKLEFLALKWSVTEKFRDYLLGTSFVVYTDNNPLTYLFSTAKLEATGQKWVAQLSDFNFSIVYRPGKRNQDADVMSRYPEQNMDRVTLDKDKETVKSVCDGSMNPGPVVETIPCKSLNILDVTEDPAQPMAQIDLRELRKRQRDDPIVWSMAKSNCRQFFSQERYHCS